MTFWLTFFTAALLVGLIILAFIIEAQHRDIQRLDAEITALTEVAYDHKDTITRVIDALHGLSTTDDPDGDAHTHESVSTPDEPDATAVTEPTERNTND